MQPNSHVVAEGIGPQIGDRRSTRKNYISTLNAAASRALASMTIMARKSIPIGLSSTTYRAGRTDFPAIVTSI